MAPGEEKSPAHIIYGTECDIEEKAQEYPEYTKVFVNLQENEDDIKIWLTADVGDQLYLLSNRRYEDFNEYFAQSGGFSRSNLEKRGRGSTNSINHPTKKIKQRNLFNMFLKKPE